MFNNLFKFKKHNKVENNKVENSKVVAVPKKLLQFQKEERIFEFTYKEINIDIKIQFDCRPLYISVGYSMTGKNPLYYQNWDYVDNIVKKAIKVFIIVKLYKYKKYNDKKWLNCDTNLLKYKLFTRKLFYAIVAMINDK